MKIPIWILDTTVIRIHEQQLAEFGGAEGIRDESLLRSALQHPQNLFHYDESTIEELATAYAERLVKNHPFVDANKRTAYVVMVLFLKLNGYQLTAAREERVTKFIDLAASRISADKFAQWLSQNVAKILDI